LPVAAKVLIVILAIGAAVVAGPVIFVVGREAMQRAGQPFSASASDDIARRRGLVVAIGAAGSLLLGSVAIQNLWWAIAGGQAEDGSPGLGAIVGALVAAAVLAALNRLVQQGSLRSLPIPRALGSEVPGVAPPF
jgi:hypothetical protein